MASTVEGAARFAISVGFSDRANRELAAALSHLLPAPANDDPTPRPDLSGAEAAEGGGAESSGRVVLTGSVASA
ncbi:MAG: hypothetical protein OEV40_29445 [Acidimicrobiia bacterium]|nr:hypothetical protein [Acidimicrobiia bacterium]